MSSTDDWGKVGGLCGMASKELCRQILTADGDHPLAPLAAVMRDIDPPTDSTLARTLAVLDDVLPAMLAGDNTEAAFARHPPHLLALGMLLLDQAATRGDGIEGAPYLLAEMRLHDATVEYLADRYLSGADPEPGEFPHALDTMAAIRAGSKGDKIKAGKTKGKANKEKARALWHDFKGPKQNAGPAARWIFSQMGGSYDADGKKSREVPSEKTLRKWINAGFQGN